VLALAGLSLALSLCFATASGACADGTRDVIGACEFQDQSVTQKFIVVDKEVTKGSLTLKLGKASSGDGKVGGGYGVCFSGHEDNNYDEDALENLATTTGFDPPCADISCPADVQTGQCNSHKQLWRFGWSGAQFGDRGDQFEGQFELTNNDGDQAFEVETIFFQARNYYHESNSRKKVALEYISGNLVCWTQTADSDAASDGDSIAHAIEIGSLTWDQRETKALTASVGEVCAEGARAWLPPGGSAKFQMAWKKPGNGQFRGRTYVDNLYLFGNWEGECSDEESNNNDNSAGTDDGTSTNSTDEESSNNDNSAGTDDGTSTNSTDEESNNNDNSAGTDDGTSTNSTDEESNNNDNSAGTDDGTSTNSTEENTNGTEANTGSVPLGENTAPGQKQASVLLWGAVVFVSSATPWLLFG